MKIAFAINHDDVGRVFDQVADDVLVVTEQGDESH